MAFHPKVSIIIPVYNGSDYLREAVDSALGQTYKDIEVIVVNDGSNDGGKTEEIAKAYGDKIRYFYKGNGGVASALNSGIRNMTGDYFSWLSHDDVYDPEKIERQVRYLKKNSNRSVITYCDCEIIDKDSNVVAISRIDEKYLKNVYLTILSTAIGGCSLLIPKVCFEKVGLFNERLKTTQDNEMWLRIAVAGFSFEYLPEILLKSRDHPKQGSKTLKNYHQKEREDFYRWAIQYVGADINSIYDEMNSVLLGKKIYKAHDELLKIKYNYITLVKYYSFIRHILIGRLVANIITRMLRYAPRDLSMKLRLIFFRSSHYWERRYAKGGNSGIGSHGYLAVYKAGVINSFVRENNIQSVIEFGCGDGHQLSHFKIPGYVGLDVSRTIIKRCKERFRGDPTKRFFLYENTSPFTDPMIGRADLTLSVDILFHLVEDDIFLAYIDNLFGHSDKYVLIYSTNFDKSHESPHQLDRKFTPTIQERMDDFELLETIINPHKGSDTMSDWFIYKKRN